MPVGLGVDAPWRVRRYRRDMPLRGGATVALLAGLVVVLAGWWGVRAGTTAIGLFEPQTSVTVVNDTDTIVDLTSLWDNRDGLRPGSSTVLHVDSGSVEDCEVDGRTPEFGGGCLALDARGSLREPHTVRLAEAPIDEDISKCNV
jgi:hypothetical protein